MVEEVPSELDVLWLVLGLFYMRRLLCGNLQRQRQRQRIRRRTPFLSMTPAHGAGARTASPPFWRQRGGLLVTFIYRRLENPSFVFLVHL